MKKVIFIAILLGGGVLFYFLSSSKIVKNDRHTMVPKKYISKKEKFQGGWLNYEDARKYLKNVDENSEIVSINNKKLSIVSDKVAIAKTEYRKSMGVVLSEKEGYFLIENNKKIQKIKNKKYILKSLNKPQEYIFSGKLLVREKQNGEARTILQQRGFKIVDYVKSLNIGVFKAPEEFSLNKAEEVIESLPAQSKATWELIIESPKIR